MRFDFCQKNIIKTSLAVLFTAVFLVAVCMSVIGAQTTREGIVNVTDGNRLNIRADAGTNYNIVGSLTEGEVIPIYAEKIGTDNMVWYMTEHDGKVGYVRSDYIIVKEPVVEDTTTSTPEDTTIPDDTTTSEGETTSPDDTTTPDGETTSPEDSSGNNEPQPSEFEAYLTEQGFPESYKPYLRELHALYPNWVFKAQHTGFEYSYAVTNQLHQSLIWKDSISSWKSIEGDAYNWNTNQWNVFDGDGWVRASRALIEYYVDPRNFLGVNTVFQFLEQSFDGNIQSVDGVNRIIAGTFMENDIIDSDGNNLNYSSVIFEAGKTYGVNPYVLASMIVLEQGSNGSSIISGTVPGYEGYYNYFNIGAYNQGGLTAVQRGLWYAKGGNNGSTSNLRPWNTRLKAINGGAYFYANNYTNKGQTTLYLKRFNVQGDKPFTGQYMQAIHGAESEAVKLSQGYTQELRNVALSFYIPVFDNMPETPYAKPTGDGSPNMKLSSLSVEGFELTPEFSVDNLEYMLVVTPNVTSININATAMEGSATIEGLGVRSLVSENNVFEIKVTAGNGTVRTYKITVAKENSDSYGKVNVTDHFKKDNDIFYGIAPGTTVGAFKPLFVTEGSVVVKSPSGAEKGDADVMATDDILIVYTTTGVKHGEYRASVKGDLNCDGKVNISDLLKVRNNILGTAELPKGQFLAGDVTEDGKISISDLLKIRNHILGTASIA